MNLYRTWLSKLSRSSVENAHMGPGAVDRHESATCELTSASAVEADLMGYFEGSRVVGASVAGEGGAVLPATDSALFCCCILASRFAFLRIRCCSLIFSRFAALYIRLCWLTFSRFACFQLRFAIACLSRFAMYHLCQASLFFLAVASEILRNPSRSSCPDEPSACTHTAFAVVAVGAVPPAAFTALSTAAGAAGDCVLFVPVAFAAAVVLGVGSFTSKTSPPTIIFWPVEAGTVLHSTLILPHPPDDDKPSSPATFAGRGVGDSPLRDTATADEPFWPPSEDEPFE